MVEPVGLRVESIMKHVQLMKTYTGNQICFFIHCLSLYEEGFDDPPFHAGSALQITRLFIITSALSGSQIVFPFMKICPIDCPPFYWKLARWSMGQTYSLRCVFTIQPRAASAGAGLPRASMDEPVGLRVDKSSLIRPPSGVGSRACPRFQSQRDCVPKPRVDPRSGATLGIRFSTPPTPTGVVKSSLHVMALQIEAVGCTCAYVILSG